MNTRIQLSRRGILLVLHPVFALTGAADVIAGPLLPPLARSFHLSDSQSGFLLFWIFTGTAVGALLCRGNYARVLQLGLAALAASCLGMTAVPRLLLYPCAFCFGVSAGAPMTAVSLFVGRNYPERRAATLTLLNFTWSAGAMLAPLLAARLLAIASWRAVYLALASASVAALLAVLAAIRDTEEAPRATPETTGLRNLRRITLFAVFFFLQVGMESMFGSWISTYVLRAERTTLALAAAAVTLYWAGFLGSRGLSPLLLLRVRASLLLRLALFTAFCAALLLLAAHATIAIAMAIVLLGAALAPVFPIALAAFFDRARHSSDSRFVLALSGFGGSVFPWLAGVASHHAGSLRAGLLIGPATLLAMLALLPLLGVQHTAMEERVEAVSD